jgi:hypothetical protein
VTTTPSDITEEDLYDRGEEGDGEEEERDEISYLGAWYHEKQMEDDRLRRTVNSREEELEEEEEGAGGGGGYLIQHNGHSKSRMRGEGGRGTEGGGRVHVGGARGGTKEIQWARKLSSNDVKRIKQWQQRPEMPLHQSSSEKHHPLLREMDPDQFLLPHERLQQQQQQQQKKKKEKERKELVKQPTTTRGQQLVTSSSRILRSYEKQQQRDQREEEREGGGRDDAAGGGGGYQLQFLRNRRSK